MRIGPMEIIIILVILLIIVVPIVLVVSLSNRRKSETVYVSQLSPPGSTDDDLHYCSHCGQEIAPGSLFCGKCGASVRPLVQYGAANLKSKIAAGLFGIFLGGLGVHRFYLGFVGIGIAQIAVTIITFGFGAIWGFIEGILILTGSFDRDADGQPLRD